MIAHAEPIAPDQTLHLFRGETSNAYILEDRNENASYLIDCGMPKDAPQLIEALLGMPPLKAVVCTHFHVDHTAGWLRMRPRFRYVPIHFHRAAEPFVTGRQRLPWPRYNALTQVLLPVMFTYGYIPGLLDLWLGGLYGTPLKKGFPCGNVIYVEEGQPILPGFDTLHTPGHRPDEISFWHRESSALIVGDLLLERNDQLISNPYVVSQQDQDASLAKINCLPPGLVFPGHGKILPYADLAEPHRPTP